MSKRLEQGELDSRVIEFLDKVGTGVIGYRRKEREFSRDAQEMRKELDSVVNKFLKGVAEVDLGGIDKVSEIQLAHRGPDGNAIYFDLDRESAGTRRLLVLLDSVFKALDNGAPLVIDELDASLHTLACEAVLALFSSSATNPNGAQLTRIPQMIYQFDDAPG